MASLPPPPSLIRKYGNAAKQMSWQFLFPSSVRCTHPIDGYICRHHIHETSYAKYLRQAVSKSGVMKRVTAHTFRHSFIKYVLLICLTSILLFNKITRNHQRDTRCNTFKIK
jgi:integrase